MKYETADAAYSKAAGMSNGIMGDHLKCVKRWLLGDSEIPLGTKLCVIMESAVVGEILWSDGRISDRHTGRMEDGYAPLSYAEVTPGWNPHVSFQVVFADGERLGELATFTSSSWGGQRALLSLINPYLLKRKTQFPICSLGLKPRRDINNNIDPTLTIVGWSDRNNFELLVAPVDRQLAAPATAPESEDTGLSEERDYSGDFASPEFAPNARDRAAAAQNTDDLETAQNIDDLETF